MKHRVFIAFSVGDEAMSELDRVQDILMNKNKKAHVTWMKPQGFHVTVQFLGEIEDYQIEKVKALVLDIANTHHGFSYWLDHLDAFPTQSQSKIVTMRVVEEKRASVAIHDALVDGLKESGIVKDIQPWKPHITLGRNRGEHKIQGFDTIDFEKKIWKVDTIEIMESDPKADGPKYTVLESYELKNK